MRKKILSAKNIPILRHKRHIRNQFCEDQNELYSLLII